MSEHSREPRPDDAVLGGQHQAPIDAAVLGGIKSVKANLVNEIITQFNSKNQDYFEDPRFHPLTLTSASTQGLLDLEALRIIQFVPSDNSQSLFLKTEIEGKIFLIPNITLPLIARNLWIIKEYPEIFVICQSSGILQITKPATLKLIGSDIWELEEAGEFWQ